ncbi:MAG TPA: hypothetical protein PKM12_09605, partial [Marmoricola sp.]|nr:hypothetical protein [Marmoricola sp.]
RKAGCFSSATSSNRSTAFAARCRPSSLSSAAKSPTLAAAANQALLSRDPNVERLRLRIGAEFVARLEQALGSRADAALIDALAMAFSGALLQVGMELMTYEQLGERLNQVIAVIMKGHP